MNPRDRYDCAVMIATIAITALLIMMSVARCTGAA